jgi:hypothetical protein
MRTVLEGLQAHPHVERIGLPIDFDDAWQVAYGLLQILPLPEAVKAALLSEESIDPLMAQLLQLLNELGEDS